MKIDFAGRDHYPQLIELWEASVRATHDFLNEEDIAFLRPLILEKYFDAVDLCRAVSDNGELLGFIGSSGDNIEMLFIAPRHRGRGVGALLAGYAIRERDACKVDVNEQNPQAIGFYKHLGFRTVGRSPTDGQGKPFPLLHMELAQTDEARP